MQEQIEIFPNGAEVKPADTEKQRVMAAIERVTPLALQKVAGNTEDERRVHNLAADLRSEISRGGQVSAKRYITQVGAAA
jgi:hypothetical protein